MCQNIWQNLCCIIEPSLVSVSDRPVGVYPRVQTWSLEYTRRCGMGNTKATFVNSLCPRRGSCNLNSLAAGQFEWNLRYLILQIISVTDGWGIFCELALLWMSLDLTDNKPTLVQVMACCHQATSRYLSHCWPRSLSHIVSLGPNELNQWFSNLCYG